MTLDDYFAAPGAMTPAELADKIGISESTLSRIRRGKQNTTRDVILKIIAATGERVTADALLGLHSGDPNDSVDPASPNNAAAPIGGVTSTADPADKTDEIIGSAKSPDNGPSFIRGAGEAVVCKAEADSRDAPFPLAPSSAASPSTCSTTDVPPNMPADSATYSAPDGGQASQASNSRTEAA